MLNGNPVEKELEKGEFKTGDTVSIRFEGKDFVGTVDFGENEESLNERGDSPRTVQSLLCETAEQQDSSHPKRKKRYRSWEGGFHVQDDTPTRKLMSTSIIQRNKKQGIPETPGQLLEKG